MSKELKFTKCQENIPEDHIEIVNITTNGDKELCVNFNAALTSLLEERHLRLMLAALEDAFYRLRPDLRRQ
jgi:hypothetical protein